LYAIKKPQNNKALILLYYLTARMKHLFIALILLSLFSCNSTNDKKSTRLNKWVHDNQNRLENDIDTVINNYILKEKPDSNWSVRGIAITMYAPNSIGALAKIAGDSTECIIVDLTFYKDKMRKRRLMIAAQDSSCLDKLNAIEIRMDSTDKLIFGKNPRPLYTKEGDPLF
jgi:hypothetical protein